MTLEYRQRLDEIVIDRKSKKDFVTEADVAVEAFLVGAIQKRYPTHGIWGEESGVHDGNEYRWVIDPIDGTMSFCRGQAYYSISIAVEQKGQAILGAVYAPVLDELFEAKRGEGATLNGKAIRVSSESDLSECMMATGFACIRNNKVHNNIPYFNRLMPEIMGIRRCGSAALDLCYVACGRVDGYWELNLNAYDVAAGLLVVQEAGGRSSDFQGRALAGYGEIVATNDAVHNALVRTLAEVKGKL